MEAIVVPQRRDHWDKFGMRSALQGLRSEAGEQGVDSLRRRRDDGVRAELL